VRASCSLLVLALASLPVAPPVVAAQVPLIVGRPASGRLVPSDPMFPDSTHYKMYAFTGNRGDTVTADLSSDDFDTNLIIADANGNRLASDDDSGGKCNARVKYRLPDAANYRLYANSSYRSELGSFRLTLVKGTRPAPTDTSCSGFGRVAGMVQVGQSVLGALNDSGGKFTDSIYFARWILPVQANQTFTIDMTSNDLDPFLRLERGHRDLIVENDDGGGGCNSRIVYTSTDDRPLRIVAMTASKNQQGTYTLRVTDGESPTSPKGNCRFSGAAVASRPAGGGGQPTATPVSTQATSDRTIAPGQRLSGRLTTDDSLWVDTTYIQTWTLTAVPNSRYTVDLSSDEFDPYLMVDGPGVNDGDLHSGQGCAARVAARFPEAGPYRIRVNTTTHPLRQTGRFTLAVIKDSLGKVEGDCSPSQRPAGGGGPVAVSSGGRTIASGQTMTGQLTANDELFPDTTYLQRWSFTAAPGRAYTIDLASDDFEPYLMLEGPGITEFQGNMHGGPGCAARISRVFPQAGPYMIKVNTTTAVTRATGTFRLTVTAGQQDKMEDACTPPSGAQEPLVRESAMQAITIGQTIQGRLTRQDVFRDRDSTYAQMWSLHGTGGQVVTIDLESDDFDSYLFVMGPGIDRSLQDNDSGGNCHARLTMTFPQTGDYEVIVNTDGKYATGAYTLSVTTGSKPKSLARCRRDQ